MRAFYENNYIFPVLYQASNQREGDGSSGTSSDSACTWTECVHVDCIRGTSARVKSFNAHVAAPSAGNALSSPPPSVSPTCCWHVKEPSCNFKQRASVERVRFLK